MSTKEYNDLMPRNRSRDRHGRGVRHSLTGSLYRSGGSSSDQFAQIVRTTVEYLRETFPEELSELNFRVMDAPILGANSTYVKRWSARKETMTVILYRLPILRLGSSPSPVEERLKIEHHVFEAAADLIGKEPWDLIFGED